VVALDVAKGRPRLAALVCASSACALLACGEGVRGGDGPVGEAAVLGKGGGTIAFHGVSLTLLAGALDHDILISVRRSRAPERAVWDSVIDISPSALTLNKTATLVSTFEVPTGKTAGDVTLGVLFGASWRPVANAQTDRDNYWVSGQIVQLSTYAPVATCGNNGQCPSGRCDSGICQP
jgi:hypothetical protein